MLPPPPYSTSFLNLPRELRDEIYIYSFDEGSFYFEEENIAFIVELREQNSNDTPKWAGLPPWLLTCKQILFEGLDAFHRHAVCTDFYLNSHYSNSVIPLVSLAQLWKIDLSSCSWEAALEFKVKKSPYAGVPDVLTLNHEVSNDLWVLADYLRWQQSSVRELSLKIRLPADFDLDLMMSSENCEVNLWLLREFGTNLTKAELVLAEPWISDRYSMRIAATVYLQAQHEAVRLTKIMVTGNDGTAQSTSYGRGYILKDWIQEHHVWPTTYFSSIPYRVEHDWHVECRRSRKQTSSGQPAYTGLRCFRDSYGTHYWIDPATSAVGYTRFGWQW